MRPESVVVVGWEVSCPDVESTVVALARNAEEAQRPGVVRRLQVAADHNVVADALAGTWLVVVHHTLVVAGTMD